MDCSYNGVTDANDLGQCTRKEIVDPHELRRSALICRSGPKPSDTAGVILTKLAKHTLDWHLKINARNKTCLKLLLWATKRKNVRAMET